MSELLSFFLQQALAETNGEPESPMQRVGQFLNNLLQDHTLPRRCLVEAGETPGLSLHVAPRFTQPLYSCPTFTQIDFICLILNICSGIPEAYQVLRCQETTMEEELNLFLKRAERHPSQYFMLNVNKLPYKLQEVR